MALSEEKLCSVGCKWMYTFNCLEAKKFIPDYLHILHCAFVLFAANKRHPGREKYLRVVTS